MTAALDRLYQVASGTQRYTNTTTSMEAWMRRAMEPPPPAPIASEAASAAQHHSYRPRNPADREHRSQQETDAALKEKWTTRLLQALRPYPLPYLVENPDALQQRRLLGRTKWTTLRSHALTLERTLKVTPDLLLWQEGANEMQRTQAFLDKMVQQGCKPSRLRSAWSTLNWICKTTGYPLPSDHAGLQASYLHSEDALTKVTYREKQRAHMPPDEVVQALEAAACNHNRSPVYRYYASTLRLQLGISARFVDMQHTAPSTLGVHSHHIDLAPWQTKTTHRGQPIKTKYIATKHSRSNLDWWEAVKTYSKTMVTTFPQMDFMYPRMDATKTKFVLQPASAAQVTKMFRHILACEGLPPATTNKMSLHGLRLWAAEMAYRAQVPRDLRKYIGHWSQEETADTYTREHAIIVTKIWNHIFDNYDATLAKTQPTAPVEPSDPYYLGDLPEPNNVHLIKFDLDDRHVARSRKRQQADAPAPLMKKKPKAHATPPRPTTKTDSLTQQLTRVLEETPAPHDTEEDSPTLANPFPPTTPGDDEAGLSDIMALAVPRDSPPQTPCTLGAESPTGADAAGEATTPPMLPPGTEAPANANHEEGPDDPAAQETHAAVSTGAASPHPSEQNGFGPGSAGTQAGTRTPEPDGTTLDFTESELREALETLPDTDQHPLGPLRVAQGTKRSNGYYRLHFVTPDLRTIGCKKIAHPANYVWVDDALDYAILRDTKECHWCGKHSRVPTSWAQPQAPPAAQTAAENLDTDDASSDDDSDGTEESATDPEALIVKP